MFENPILNLLALGAGAYFLYLWWSDTKSAMASSANNDKKGTLPGAEFCSAQAVYIPVIGAIILILFISFIEFKLGVFDQQTKISWLFLPAMLGAAITEEIIFRGYLVVANRGKRLLVISIISFSAIFALVHPYLWMHTIESPSGMEWITTLRPNLELHAILSTASIFVLSLWFYIIRFWPINPKQSLLPCFCAHAAANIVVFIVKATTGYVA